MKKNVIVEKLGVFLKIGKIDKLFRNSKYFVKGFIWINFEVFLYYYFLY